jgi:hypothetical protein
MFVIVQFDMVACSFRRTKHGGEVAEKRDAYAKQKSNLESDKGIQIDTVQLLAKLKIFAAGQASYTLISQQ